FGRKNGALVGIAPRRIRPLAPSSVISASASSIWARICRARASSRRPASVSATFLVCRSKTGWPISSSSRAIARLSAGCVIPSSSPARVKFCRSATLREYRSWLISMSPESPSHAEKAWNIEFKCICSISAPWREYTVGVRIGTGAADICHMGDAASAGSMSEFESEPFQKEIKMRRKFLTVNALVGVAFLAIGSSAPGDDADFSALVKRLEGERPQFAQRQQDLLQTRY